MKVESRDGYILVTSPRLTYLCGLFSGMPRKARAAALFPFIVFRSEDEIVPWILNHEQIHFKQQLETLFVGSILLAVFETLYACVVLRLSFAEAYKWRSGEQEAYRNQQDQEYLKDRPFWAQFKYVRDKRMFTFGKPGEIIFTSAVDASNQPNKSR